MKEHMTEEQSKVILKALDEAIETGPWEQSTYLRVIGKSLKKIRDDFFNEVSSLFTDAAKSDANLLNRVAMRSGQQEVYISLYASNGDSLASWERVVANLPRQVISRPIYADEEDVRQLIRLKENKLNEAYVAVFVDTDAILAVAPDKIQKDRYGKSLLLLKDKVINLDNISRFVHHTGIYQYSKGRFIKKSPTE